MKDDDVDLPIRRFLDGELSGDEERNALLRIAEDPEARALLRLDLEVRGRLADDPPRRAPADFGERVMRALAAGEADEGERAHAERGVKGIRTLWNELRRPRTLEWRPAGALLVAAAVVLATSAIVAVGGILSRPEGSVTLRAGEAIAPQGREDEASTNSPSLARASGSDTVFVRFVLEDPGARSVAVAGDFSSWEPIPLVPRPRDGGSLWTGVVAVPKGEHRYMFVIDGTRWVTDPLATAHRDDGFGNRNAILSL